jgi:dihydrofolate reductase
MKVVAFENLTLDGVMQAPGRPDEDVRGGFKHGGWAIAYFDPAMGRVAQESMDNTGGLLFGRRTYQDFFSVWPNRKDNPFTDVLNNSRKYVASTTLEEPLPWQNSILLKGDAAETVARLKKEPGKQLVVLGSGRLVQSLMRSNLVDEFVLQIHPLILGAGLRLFAEGTTASIRLVDSKTTPTGVVIATYRNVGAAVLATA